MNETASKKVSAAETVQDICGLLDEAVSVSERICVQIIGESAPIKETEAPTCLMQALGIANYRVRMVVERLREIEGTLFG